MNLLRDFPLLLLWRRFAVRRGPVARPVYVVTVPAPLAGGTVVALRRPVVVNQPAPLPRVVNG